MNLKLLSVTWVIIYFWEVKCANILIVWPMYVRSHIRSFQPLFEELVDRQHNVTIISGYPLRDNLKSNYTFVDVSSQFPVAKLTSFIRETRKFGQVRTIKYGAQAFLDYADRILSFSEVQRIIQSGSHYDLVMCEIFLLDAFFAFGNKFNAPTIAMSPMKLIPYYNWILCDPHPSSYFPALGLPMTEKMSLVSRIINLIYEFLYIIIYESISLPGSQKLIEKHFHFDEENVPQIRYIMKNISVTFMTTHYSFGYIKPQLPNIINVAGLHFTPPKSLPSDIQKFMDEAESGVIYLSLGSTVEPSALANLGDTFIQILKHMPQKVIMKWDQKLLKNVPSSIMVKEWISQTDVLNHPKCVLFITQGGVHSCVEAINASVPVVGIPIFSDQEQNLAAMEYYEIGKLLQLEDIPTKLAENVEEVLNNPKVDNELKIVLITGPLLIMLRKFTSPVIDNAFLMYRNNIKKRSMLFKERLVQPLDEAMYWVDHVIKYKNTDHLKSAALQLDWYELYLVDVLLILLLAILSVAYFTKYCLRLSMHKLISPKGQRITDSKFNHTDSVRHGKSE